MRWFKVDGCLLRFSLLEFCLVTRLQFDEVQVEAPAHAELKCDEVHCDALSSVTLLSFLDKFHCELELKFAMRNKIL